MQLNPYLMFNGQCEEAFKFYQRTLGAKIESALLEDGTPADPHTAWGKKVMHGRIQLNGQTVMASDCPADRYQRPQGFSLNLSYQSPGDAERVYHGLAEGGQVQMPIQETFWAVRFGMVVDRFGIPWMINCEKARIEVEKMQPCREAEPVAV